ncbi:MAG: hypothetical protein RLZZ292_2239 [Bacteroidota bacterium]|jgi:hypothetical protein
MATIGITDFLARKFDVFDFEGKFKDSFGTPEKNMRMLVYGKPGNGKTEFCFQLAKYLCDFKRVYYNSFEQGISKTLQDAIIRNDMADKKGKIVFGDKDSFEDMMLYLKKRNSPSIVFIDSRDYLNLTGEQFRTLMHAFPKKAFIVICWENNGRPKSEHGKAIEFMCDIKVFVHNFIAKPRSRFGGNEDYVIWDKGTKRTTQPLLF